MTIPSEDEVRSYIRDRRNWGRWGADDQVGAVNLVTAEKRVAAAKLVRTGRTVSLSRPFPKVPAANNLNPAQHWMRSFEGANGGGVVDYYAISYHGFAATHIDALCHVWDSDGLWNGRAPAEITANGTRWGGIENWSTGIVTRGVLLDVPRHRGVSHVTMETPVHGDELRAIAAAQGVTVEPGDALIVYSGREQYNLSNPVWGAAGLPQPGLHASCLPVIRDWDVSILGWDMMDMTPSGYADLRWSVHAALFAYGVGLMDNALLEPLSQACQEEGRYEFMLMLAPLVVIGGTGSPLNPLAMF